MERCDNLVKFTVGGIDRYYQTFYDDAGEVKGVRLYDREGAFVREFKSLDKLMNKVRRDARQKERKRLLDGVIAAEQYDAAQRKRLKDDWISEEEKIATQAVFLKRFAELQGDMDNKTFAEKLGLQKGVVLNYMKGWRFPTAHAMKRIADRCGVTVDWLLGRE